MSEKVGENVTLYCGDCIEVLRGLPSESVQCCVTSPPYWGLRDYGTALWEGGDPECNHVQSKNEHGGQRADRCQEGYRKLYADICSKCGAHRIDQQIGLEQTPEEYVARMVEVFREIKRVLRSDGVAWLNLGDSYAGGGGSSGHTSETENCGRKTESYGAVATGGRVPFGLKPKDLVGIPWMVAFALRADGWFLRQDVIWEKPSPMPESVKDRCTKAHEYIFLLTKSGKYFYDAEAIKEDSVDPESLKGRRKRNADKFVGQAFSDTRAGFSLLDGQKYPKRNKRSVWTVTTKPYSEAHFATFPPDLIQPCILAGTSEKGCCPKCGKPWRRVVESKRVMRHELSPEDSNFRPGRYSVKSGGLNEYAKGGGQAFCESRTIGWRPGCECGEEPVPCVVLDPFNGSGTSGEVSVEFGRAYVGIDLNPEYIEMSKRRIRPVVKKKQMLAFVLEEEEELVFDFQEEEENDDETY